MSQMSQIVTKRHKMSQNVTNVTKDNIIPCKSCRISVCWFVEIMVEYVIDGVSSGGTSAALVEPNHVSFPVSTRNIHTGIEIHK